MGTLIFAGYALPRRDGAYGSAKRSGRSTRAEGFVEALCLLVAHALFRSRCVGRKGMDSSALGGVAIYRRRPTENTSTYRDTT